MPQTLSLVTPELLRKRKWGVEYRHLIAGGVIILAVAGLLSPLFNLHAFDHAPSLKALAQHLYFETLAGLGGVYSSSFCKHTRHRIVVLALVDLIATYLLVTIVG